MIRVSQSYGYGDDNRYNIDQVTNNIQLAIYKYDIYNEKKEKIFNDIIQNKINVNVVHLPLDTLKISHNLTLSMITNFYDILKCTKFVIHPNKGIKDYLTSFVNIVTNENINLCIETFAWKRNKVFRSPLEICEVCSNPRFSMTIDTSHIENIWFDYRIMNYLLQYTSVIHLSNRKGKEQHMPFNVDGGNLDLVKFVKDLKNQYNWGGDIVLEYMPDYSYKLKSNIAYINELLK